MKERIVDIYQEITQNNESIAEIIFALTQARNTSSSMLAHHIKGNQKHASKVKKIERTYRYNTDCADFLMSKVFDAFKGNKALVPLDRTNWFVGGVSVNAFIAFLNCKNRGGICAIKMLENNGGNSHSDDRIELVKNILKHKRVEEIEAIIGDREFYSVDFLEFLLQEKVPFVIRLKENLKFVQKHLKRVPPKGKTLKNIKVELRNDRFLIADLSIKKIKNKWLLLISSRVSAPMQIYKERWNIEMFFKSIKTAGFNIEKTKITKPERLKLLFAMCSMAYLMCTIIGTHIDIHFEQLRRKKDEKSLILSFFRAGADWLKAQVHRHFTPCHNLATLIFSGL